MATTPLKVPRWCGHLRSWSPHSPSLWWRPSQTAQPLEGRYDMCVKMKATLTKKEDSDPFKDSPLDEKGHNCTDERQRRPALGQIHFEFLSISGSSHGFLCLFYLSQKEEKLGSMCARITCVCLGVCDGGNYHWLTWYPYQPPPPAGRCLTIKCSKPWIHMAVWCAIQMKCANEGVCPFSS